MQATLLTEWQCSILYYKSNVALMGVSKSCKQREKPRVYHVKTIPGNLLLTVKIIIQIQLAGNYGNRP